MAKFVNPAESFLRVVRDTFGERLSDERYALYRDQLKRLAIPAGTWQALGEPERLMREFDSFPALPDLIRYCMRDMPSAAGIARWSFERSSTGNQRYCTKQFPIGDKERVLELLPADAKNINLIVDSERLSPKEEYEKEPGLFPEYDRNGKLTERGRHEVEEIKQQAITQHVNEDLDAYRVKLICLTDGHRGSMPKRLLDPLEAQARAWAETAGEQEIAEAREQAAKILLAKFPGVTLADLLCPLKQQMAPADYDDSEQALGKQRAAQLERLAEAERMRAVESQHENSRQAFADF